MALVAAAFPAEGGVQKKPAYFDNTKAAADIPILVEYLALMVPMLAHSLKQLVERRPALKVIYMSGYTDDAIVHHGVLDPGIAFLNKPFTSQTLGAKIREVLDR